MFISSRFYFRDFLERIYPRKTQERHKKYRMRTSISRSRASYASFECADMLHSIRANVQFLRRDGRNRWYFGNPVEHCAIVQDRLSDPLHISRVHGYMCVHIRNFLALNSANCLTIPPSEKRSYQFEFIVIKCLSSKDSFHSIVRACISDRNLLFDMLKCSFP